MKEKLPRKRKKAFIKEHGQRYYKWAFTFIPIDKMRYSHQLLNKTN